MKHRADIYIYTHTAFLNKKGNRYRDKKVTKYFDQHISKLKFKSRGSKKKVDEKLKATRFENKVYSNKTIIKKG